MKVAAGKDNACVVTIRPNEIACVTDGYNSHKFIGMVQDTETAVDISGERRLASLAEENNLDKCVAALSSTKSKLYLHNIVHNNSHLICTITTPWLYKDAKKDIVSRRHFFFAVFEEESTPLDTPRMLTELMRRMDITLEEERWRKAYPTVETQG